MKTAVELKEIADICEERGNYSKAVRLHNKALSSAERTFGKDSSELIPYVYNVAMISLAVDDHARAKAEFSRLLNLFATTGAATEDIEEAQQYLFELDKTVLAAHA